MIRTRTLLVSQDPYLVNEVQKLHDETDHSRLEICGRLDRVPSRLSQDNTLLMIQYGSGVETEHVKNVLALAERALVKAVVISCSTASGSDFPNELRPYPTYRLPADLPSLRTFLVDAHTSAARGYAEQHPTVPPA